MPVPRWQFVELMHWIRGDAREDIAAPSLRIDAVHFGGDDEAIHGRGALASSIGTAEQILGDDHATPKPQPPAARYAI